VALNVEAAGGLVDLAPRRFGVSKGQPLLATNPSAQHPEPFGFRRVDALRRNAISIDSPPFYLTEEAVGRFDRMSQRQRDDL
jgi:hypothetical protein